MDDPENNFRCQARLRLDLASIGSTAVACAGSVFQGRQKHGFGGVMQIALQSNFRRTGESRKDEPWLASNAGQLSDASFCRSLQGWIHGGPGKHFRREARPYTLAQGQMLSLQGFIGF
jgi:hypothetical protein